MNPPGVPSIPRDRFYRVQRRREIGNNDHFFRWLQLSYRGEQTVENTKFGGVFEKTHCVVIGWSVRE